MLVKNSVALANTHVIVITSILSMAMKWRYIPFPQPELRWRSPGMTATCWYSWLRPAELPPLLFCWPDDKPALAKHANTGSHSRLTWASCAAHLFATGQINQVEFPAQLLLRLGVLLLDVDQEDAVTPGAVLVHVWGGETSGSVSAPQHAVYVVEDMISYLWLLRVCWICLRRWCP